MHEMDCVMGLVSPLALNQREDGLVVLNLWKNYLPSLLPDRYGNWEPENRLFDPNDLDTAADAWDWPFLAKSKVTRMQSSAWPKRKKAAEGIENFYWNLSADAKAVS